MFNHPSTIFSNVLCNNFQENQQQAEVEEPEKHDHVHGAKSFKELMHTLPEKVSKNMARNLSVPITFVCLLHLANEKVRVMFCMLEHHISCSI